ncbi:MAG: carboxy-S-adenosyl-L-methionine synthase CmoA [Gammaproteobacteria bacterium]|nr:carboxy-S-adenosyl-L-methionine synthase CmoA [Gammaproteobacteria bacterium]
MSQDTIYSKQQNVVDFVFDENVANVFSDMIRRSVPGYESIITMLGVFAEQYVQDSSNVYDLGCSLGAATLSMRSRLLHKNCTMFAIDNSVAMAERCRQNIGLQQGPEVNVSCADIREAKIESASLVVLNFTLQFLPVENRTALLTNIADNLLPGGALVLSEKITFEDAGECALNDGLQLAFKKANGYSELEIAQKRSAIENVLIPETLGVHLERLKSAGFSQAQVWFQCFNFVSIIAIK